MMRLMYAAGFSLSPVIVIRRHMVSAGTRAQCNPKSYGGM